MNRWVFVTIATLVLILAICGYRYAESQLSLHALQLTDPKQLTDNGLEKIGLRSDGKQLYFSQFQNGWLALAAMPIDGGPVRTLWNPPMNVLLVDISPDGRSLLALNGIYHYLEREVWLIPLDGSAPRKLGSISAHALAYAPDGKTIAFANGQKIYLANSDGSSVRQIGAYSGIPDTLHWASDGTRLRFVLLDPVSRKPSLWELVFTDHRMTALLRSITLPIESTAEFRWSPARQEDAYFFSAQGIHLAQYGRLWWQPALQITDLHSASTDISGVAFDKASDHLFVVSSGKDHNGIEEFKPRTNEFRYILPGISGTYPAYSRDKQWIAWITYADAGGAALWVARADGNFKKQIASLEGDIELPRWSPDGMQIAFFGKVPDHPYRIYTIRHDGGPPHEAASEGSENQGAPTWSPDGKSLAYANVVCKETHSYAVHTIDLATGKIKTLPGSEGLMTARWSPDGQHIAALQPESHQLFVFDLQLRRWRKLADEIDSADLSWSPDSKFLYVALPGKDARISRISVADGKAETALRLNQLNVYGSAVAHDDVFSVTPDNNLLFSRPNPAAEIFSWQVKRR